MSYPVESLVSSSETSSVLGQFDVFGPEAEENGFREANSSSSESYSDDPSIDLILGTSGDDIIYGNDSDNIIDGGAGADELYGLGGKDTFVLNLEFFDSVDTIADFDVNQDTIRIQGVSSDANIQYDRETGKLSVDGQEVAQLETGLNLDEDNFEIF